MNAKVFFVKQKMEDVHITYFGGMKIDDSKQTISHGSVSGLGALQTIILVRTLLCDVEKV